MRRSLGEAYGKILIGGVCDQSAVSLSDEFFAGAVAIFLDWYAKVDDLRRGVAVVVHFFV